MSEIEPTAPRRNRILTTTLIAAFALAVTFASGFVAGVAADRLLLRRGHIPPMASRMIARRLDRRLDLNDEQRKQVEAILGRRHQRMNAIWSGIRPQMRREIDETNGEIERILTPEQRKRFERMKMVLGPSGELLRGRQ